VRKIGALMSKKTTSALPSEWPIPTNDLDIHLAGLSHAAYAAREEWWPDGEKAGSADLRDAYVRAATGLALAVQAKLMLDSR
jgi:hypothetical protein